MRIRPYISDLDYDKIEKWVTNERMHAMWCANLIRYPLQKIYFEETLEELAVKFKDSPYVATTDEGELVGFFCYSVNLNTNEGMLKFVIAAPEFRGKGYGREMIALAVKYGFEITNADAVQLNVFAENTNAKKCYLSVGFTERTNTDNAFRFGDEMWARCNMVIKR